MLGIKKISIVLATFAAVSVLAAPKPLSIWIMPNGASPKEKLEQRLELFTQKTGIPTQVQVLDWGEAWTRISQALASGQDAPDVLQLGTTWIPYFASRNEIKPLNQWLTEIDPSRYIPVSWNTTHIDSDTTIYSVPWFIDIRPVLANKRILKKHNITKEDLATYEGFKKAVQKINDAKETIETRIPIRGYAFPGKSDWNIPHNFAPWIWSNGGDFIIKDEQGRWKANILSKSTLQGIASYLNFVTEGLVAPEALQTNTAEIAQQFNNGELAFIVNTTEIIMQTRINGAQGGLSNAKIGEDSVMVVPIPKGKVGSVSFIGGSNLAIPAGNQRKESLDLLLFLTNDENQDAYMKQIGLLPSSKKALESWAQDEDYRELLNALSTGKTYVAHPEWGALERIFVSMFSSVWEVMEIKSLYSEEKIYDIFKEYTLMINQLLKAPSNDIMTQAEFSEVWSQLLSNTDTKVAEKEIIEEAAKQSAINDNLKKAPLVFVVMILIGFIFNFRRKSKK